MWSVGLLGPLPYRGLGQVGVLGHLTDRAIPLLAQLHDLGLKLRRKRPTRPRSLLTYVLHDAGHPSGAPTAPDLGCPSKRARPRFGMKAAGLSGPVEPCGCHTR